VSRRDRGVKVVQFSWQRLFAAEKKCDALEDQAISSCVRFGVFVIVRLVRGPVGESLR
jgi:hypothetical protein